MHAKNIYLEPSFLKLFENVTVTGFSTIMYADTCLQNACSSVA